MVVTVDHTSQDASNPSDRRRRRPIIPLVLLIAIQLWMILLTVSTQRDDPLLSPELEIPASVETQPLSAESTHTWQAVGVATGNALRATRIPDGYAFPTQDGVVVVLDSGGAVRSRLADAGILRGIAADHQRVVVYGSTSGRVTDGPALWISNDGLSWSTVTLPWNGAVRTVAFDQGRLMVDGVQRGPEGLSGVLARETETGEWELQGTPVATSNHFAIEGAFVVRERLEGEPDYRYYATSDFESFTYFSDSMLIMSGNESAWAGVVDLDGIPALRLPQVGSPIVPPDWPVVSVRLEGDLIWIQTPQTLWSSEDGRIWADIPLDRMIWSGTAMAVPVGDIPRVAVSEPGGILRVYEWQPSG
jgi:hypothetical protein